jgi:outer membrane beta-barrel protein
MKTIALITIFLGSPSMIANAAEAPQPAPKVEEVKKPNAEAPKKVEAVDISDLEENYWRPNQDELEVLQNRKYEKAHRFELAAHYGIYQGKDYVNSKSAGASLTYNFSNQYFVEVSHMKVSNQDNDFLNSVRSRFGFTPDFNREDSQSVLSAGWTPIYAKFSLLGKKISHFEMYVAPGIGRTKTIDNHTSAHFTIGQKFYITEHILFRLDWRMSRYTDRIITTQGATSRANGGPGYVDQTDTTHNIIFGLGWMF